MEHGELVGMLTFREIILHLNAHPNDAGQFTVRSIMDDAPVSVSPNPNFDEVQRLMLDKHARYLPVMDGPTLLGVIFFSDIARPHVEAQHLANERRKAFIRD